MPELASAALADMDSKMMLSCVIITALGEPVVPLRWPCHAMSYHVMQCNDVIDTALGEPVVPLQHTRTHHRRRRARRRASLLFVAWVRVRVQARRTRHTSSRYRDHAEE